MKGAWFVVSPGRILFRNRQGISFRLNDTPIKTHWIVVLSHFCKKYKGNGSYAIKAIHCYYLAKVLDHV